jgi:serine/threonine protein kinase
LPAGRPNRKGGTTRPIEIADFQTPEAAALRIIGAPEGQSSYVDRFLAEAKGLGRLNHPNIATLYALRQEDDHVCVIMEFVRGRTAEQIIQDRHGPLGKRESLAIL